MQDPLTAEAFALSPISARASPPSEADYVAIRDAFMETARGRWFLTQYADRNRNADTTAVLDAVARLEAGIAARPPATPSPAEVIAAIRPLIAEARAAADAAMIATDIDEHIAAGRRGARIIREIAWSLRETGTDPRICNILDAQLLALETLHDVLGADPRRALIGEAFDDLVLRIEDHVGNATSQRMPPKPEPVETIGANADIAAEVVSVVVEPPPASEPASTTDDGMHVPSASETAEDDAVLDLIANEMAAPEIDIAPDIVGDLEDEFDQVDSRIAELKSLAEHSSPPVMDAISEPPPLQPSLGAALIAGGVVRAPRSGSDALAPFRRMSQVEKIAFFS